MLSLVALSIPTAWAWGGGWNGGGTQTIILTNFSTPSNPSTNQTMVITQQVPQGDVGTQTVTITFANNTGSSSPSNPSVGSPAPAVNNGGGGGGGVSGGSSNARPTKPILTSLVNDNVCSTVVNDTESSFETVIRNDTPYSIFNDYITPSSDIFVVNGTRYTLNSGQKLPFTGQNTSNYLYLQSIDSIMPTNYTASVLVADIAVCRTIKAAPVLARPLPTQVHLVLNITGYNVFTSTSVPNDTVWISVNGQEVSDGVGSAIYNGSFLAAGRYTVTGKDIDSGTYINKTLVKNYLVPNLKFTSQCTNTTFSLPGCTTTARVISNDGILNATLYLNGKKIGTTGANISYTPSGFGGNYTYTFETMGNQYYSGESISYSYYSNPFPVLAPALFAVVASMAALVIISRKGRIQAHA